MTGSGRAFSFAHLFFLFVYLKKAFLMTAFLDKSLFGRYTSERHAEHVFIRLPGMPKDRMKLPMFRTVVAGLVVLGGAVACLGAQSPSDREGWRPIFNGKNFDGWYTFLPSVGKNKDPNKVFKIENGAIHVLDAEGTCQI